MIVANERLIRPSTSTPTVWETVTARPSPTACLVDPRVPTR